RTIRANPGIPATPTATATFTTPKPSIETTTMDSSSPGIATSTSTVRISTESSQRPTYPARTPSTAPAVTLMDTASPAASMDSRAPCTTLLYASRPSASVPNQCSALGPARVAARSKSLTGSNGANRPGTAAQQITSSRNTAE